MHAQVTLMSELKHVHETVEDAAFALSRIKSHTEVRARAWLVV